MVINNTKLITKINLINFTVLFAIISYLLIGIFPMTLYETDALGVISGCKRIIETDTFGENYYTYNYDSQAGIYVLIISFVKLLDISLVEAYCILSALFGVLFFLMSAYLLTQLLHVSFFLCAFQLLLFQEIYSAWFYMNSATGAAFFMIGAFIVILQNDKPVGILFGGVLLALSAWTRFDIVIAFPAIILLIKSGPFSRRLILSFSIFIIFVVALFILCIFSNATNIITSAMQGGGSLSFLENQKTAPNFLSSQFARTIIGYFSGIVLILFSYGTYLIIKHKNWALFGLYMVPIMLFIGVLGSRVVAGKHLLYYTPFFALPVVYVFKHIINTGYIQNKFILFSLLIAFVFQYFIGFQVLLSSHPYGDKEYASIKPYPTFYTLLRLHPTIEQLDSLKIVIGSGSKLATSDEMLLSSGIFFSPLMWRQLKQESDLDYTAVANYINSFKGDTLHITTSQGGVYPIKNILYLNGYAVINPENKLYIWGIDYQYIWKKNDKVVIVDQATYSKEDYNQYISKLTSFHYKQYLHIAFWDWERWYLNRYGKFSDRLQNVGYLFTNHY